MISAHQLIDYGVYTTTTLSLLYSVLPKVETFADFPRFQKFYGTFLEIIKQVGLNLRGVIYPSIKTAGGSQISEAALTNLNPAKDPQP